MLGFGGQITMMASRRESILRYQAGEVAPVGRDTFNYMAEGTSSGIRTVARSVAEGFAEAGGHQADTTCPSCRGVVDPTDRHCIHCGATLAQACPSCGAIQPAEARFCGGCGKALV